MARNSKNFEVGPTRDFAIQALIWAKETFDPCCLLNSNHYDNDPLGNFSLVLAAGAISSICSNGESDFERLKEFSDKENDWIFGFLGYDLKNQLESLESNNHDGLQMPEMHFFVPRILIFFDENSVEISCSTKGEPAITPEEVFRQINGKGAQQAKENKKITMQPRVPEARYIDTVNNIRQHIQLGNIYEMNYCIEFYCEKVEIDPVSVYQHLSNLSPTPFSCFYSTEGNFLMCASPERFLRKKGLKLVSQPIKGTAPRGKTPQEDEQNRQKLFLDPKERSENVMIVDLVRNDLSRTASKGTVRVEELYGIYSFSQVHQMISTVVSELHPEAHLVDAIKCCFPMGSMTGAPKVMAMKLIEHFEDTKRGLFSGAVGYISPEKDFDFNVVIRSLVYNEKQKYLSYMAGSAITIGSVPERELEECLLKAKAMERALGN